MLYFHTMVRTTALAVFLLGIFTLPVKSADSITYTISTFAGGGLPINVSGPSASLYGPSSIAVDKSGNVFFTDLNAVIRLDAKTGTLTLVAGNGTAGPSVNNISATDAQLNYPAGVALDAAGNVYIADSGNNSVRKVSNGIITTVAGNGTSGFSGDNGAATSAQLSSPWGIAVDSAGNLFIADEFNSRIRKVSNGVITTVAGNGTMGFSGDNGPATSAGLSIPQGVSIDSAGNLFIADTQNSRIRKVSNGVITTVAGNGTRGFSGDNGSATSASLSGPSGVTADAAGNLYIADGNRVRKIANGVIFTVAGTGNFGASGDNGPATSADLVATSISVDLAGDLFITDLFNRRIRKVMAGVITTVAGNGGQGFGGDNVAATSAQLDFPSDAAADADGNIYVADSNSRVLKISNGVITAVAGNGVTGFSGDNGPAVSAQLSMYFSSGDGQGALAVDGDGSLYIADTGNNRIRKVTKGVITTVAGTGIAGFSGDDGPATSAQLNSPASIAVDAEGDIFIADTFNDRIRKITNGVITTVAGTGADGFSGDGGSARSAELSAPTSIAIDSAGDLFIADRSNNRVRKVSNGVITTVAGNGTAGFSGDDGLAVDAHLGTLDGIAVNSSGDLFIAEGLNYGCLGDCDGNVRVRKVTKGVITTIAGNGVSGFSGDGGPATAAELNLCYCATSVLAVDSAGNVYIADTNNDRIRVLTPSTNPVIPSGGVVPLYSTVTTIQPGEWVSIYGSNLATSTKIWDGDFPTSLGGTSVTIHGKPAYLYLVSPGQINLQAPDDTATGAVPVVVTSPNGTATSTVTLAPFAPSWNLLDHTHVAGIILRDDGAGAYGGGTYDIIGPTGSSLGYPTVAAKAGDSVELFAVGLGATNRPVAAGQAFIGAASTANAVNIFIGGVNVTPTFAGLSSAGLYQINLTIPAGLSSGDVSLQASVGGAVTPAGVVISLK